MTDVQRHALVSEDTAPTAWEQAYLRFETPEQEIRKFERRLVRLGARGWQHDAEILELFCGRGNGLRALRRLGFSRTQGVDLSLALARHHEGVGRVVVGDCRQLPFGDGSRDILIVQGGLHHLLDLPADLTRAIAEAARVLRPNGRLAIVEPWPTPFLAVVHRICRVPLARKLSQRVDALASMIDLERDTYERWLAEAVLIRTTIAARFDVEYESVGWGKITIVGRSRAARQGLDCR